MDREAADLITQHLRDRHGAMSRASHELDRQLERSLSVLPDGGFWAVAMGSEPAVFYRFDDTLFTVAAPEAPEGGVIVRSRKVAAGSLAIALEWGESIRLTQALRRQITKWTIQQDGEGPFKCVIEGSYDVAPDGTEDCDRDETFAREFAQMAGWTWSVQEPQIRALA